MRVSPGAIPVPIRTVPLLRQRKAQSPPRVNPRETGPSPFSAVLYQGPVTASNALDARSGIPFQRIEPLLDVHVPGIAVGHHRQDGISGGAAKGAESAGQQIAGLTQLIRHSFFLENPDGIHGIGVRYFWYQSDEIANRAVRHATSLESLLGGGMFAGATQGCQARRYRTKAVLHSGHDFHECATASRNGSCNPRIT